jgi:hypothetical protein
LPLYALLTSKKYAAPSDLYTRWCADRDGEVKVRKIAQNIDRIMCLPVNFHSFMAN